VSTVESDGFVIESSNPDANAVRESLGVDASPSTPEAVARPAASAPEREADGDAATPVAADAETPETPDSGRERGADGKFAKRDSVQARIDKAVAQQRAAERERDTYRAQLESYRTPPTAPAEPQERPAPQQDPATGPQLAEFDSYESWVDARAEWKAEQKWQQIQAAQYEQVARQQHEQAVLTHTERIQSFAAKTPDYFEKIQEASRLPVSAAMEAAIIASNDGPAIAYFLATHPEEGAQLAYETQSLGTAAASVVRRLLESKVHATPTASNGSVAGGYRPNVSAPIKPVGSAPVVAETSLDDLPFGPEFVRRAFERDRKARR
jgi:hypothetical protein